MNRLIASKEFELITLKSLHKENSKVQVALFMNSMKHIKKN